MSCRRECQISFPLLAGLKTSVRLRSEKIATLSDQDSTVSPASFQPRCGTLVTDLHCATGLRMFP